MDPLHICTSYQATSEGVSHVKFVSKLKNVEVVSSERRRSNCSSYSSAWWYFAWNPIHINSCNNKYVQVSTVFTILQLASLKHSDATWHQRSLLVQVKACHLFCLNTLRPGQDGFQFPDDIFKYIFLNENIWISIAISLIFVLSAPINNIPALVQMMAWRRPGDKPLSETMLLSLPMHICVTWPQWVKPLLESILTYYWLES